ncbi:MAG TPA: C4-dicarboxylate transporter DctA [Chryseosolibacter sp.]|nr:C4-dicarboxylate transporter DctA [Chryseosolibacter sp.]
MRKVLSNLTFWVLLAITTGALLGHFFPDVAVKMRLLGTGFIEIIKVFIYPIIFLTISLGISGMSNLKKVGRVGGKAILYFEIVTTVALIIGIIVSYIVEPGAGVVPPTVQNNDVSQFQKQATDFSWAQFLKDNVTIQVLLFSILFGIVLSKIQRKELIIRVLSNVSKYVFRALHMVMYLAPLGAFGGMAYTIGKYGIDTLLPLAKLMATVYITMGLFVCVVLYFIMRSYRVSLWKFLRYIKEELLIVLGTSSSEAGLPSLMEKLERMGCSKPVVGLVVPAGYSFNLDGTTIYLSMAIMFLAQAFNIHLTWENVIAIIGILFVTSKGAAGVTGSGFVVLASTLTAVKIIPVEGLALLLGVDRFMSEARAITNFIGNGVAAVWLANNEREFNCEKMHAAFDEHKDPSSRSVIENVK